MANAAFRLLSASLACGFALACSNLDALPAGQCGNYIVDPGEDCDTHPAKTTGTQPWCRPAGTVGQCRYDCSSSPVQCQSGWACGSDGICRAASGEFERRKVSSSDSFALELGQFNGSKTQELLSAQVAALKIRTFDDNGTPAESFSAALQVDSVAHGLLTSGDDIDDVLLGYRGRVLALQGSTDRAPSPIAMSSRTVASETSGTARLLVASIAATAHRFGVVGSSLYAWDPAVFSSCDAAEGDALFDIDFAAELPTSARSFLTAGDFDRSGNTTDACDEVTGSQVGADRVWIYGLCANSASRACNRDPTQYPAVQLSTGATLVAGPFVGRVNQDTLPDLIVVEEQGGVQQLAAAYGVGDGSFHSDTSSLPQTGGNSRFTPLLTVATTTTPNGQGPGGGEGAPPAMNVTLLAAEDLDGDGQVDFVFSTFLALSGSSSIGTPCSGGTAYSCVTLSRAHWSAATAGDFNGDGLTDVAGWQTTETNALASLDLLLNAGNGAFNRFVVGTAGPISPLPPLRGDFDGDLFADLALAVTVPGTKSPEIQILFGSPTRPLGDAAEVAGVGALVDVAAGEQADGDTVSDLFLLTRQDSVQLTTFSGDSSRVPISGLALSNGSSRPDYEARVVRSGRFGSPNHEDIAVISTPSKGSPGGPPMDAKRAFVHLVRLDDEARPIDSDVLEGAADSLAVPLGKSELFSSFDRATIAIADLDGNGTDDLVFIASGSGESLIQIFAASEGKFVLSNEFTIQFTLKTTSAPPGDLPIVLALVADVDADHVQDVTALTDDGVIVLRGSEGSLSAARVTHLILPNADSSVFTWANLDSGSTLELVRASAAGLERFTIPGWDAELTLEGKLVSAPSGDTFPTLSSPAAITAGDVTGDGIDDLVLGAGGLWLFQGQPVLR